MSENSANSTSIPLPAVHPLQATVLKSVSDTELEFDREKIGKMEQRLRLLESAVVKNAIELRDRVSEKLESIEAKLDSEVVRFTGEERREAPDFIEMNIENNVVVFPSTMELRDDRLVRQTKNPATEFLSEFSDTLSVTRDHLEALTQSISKMRVELTR